LASSSATRHTSIGLERPKTRSPFGQSTSSITPLNGFNGTVTLSLTGNIPSNCTVRITQPGLGPLQDGEVDLQIEKHSTLTGTFAMTIHAISGSLEHDVNISLTIV